MLKQNHKGYFITVEGGEGSGKSLNALMLKDEFERKGHTVVLTRQPGGNDISDKIRAILLDAAHTHLTDSAEALLYFAAIAQNIQMVIKPALDAGYVVISDRFVDSTMVYQVLTRQSVSPELFDILYNYISGNYSPDLTLFFDVPAGIGLHRSLRRLAVADGPDESRFEKLDLEFHMRVNENYRLVHQRAVLEQHRNAYMIDCTQPMEVVTAEMMGVVFYYFESYLNGLDGLRNSL
jgi:dTMP kinase